MQDLPDADQRPSPEAGGLREPNRDAPPTGRGQGAAQGLRHEDCRANGNDDEREKLRFKT